MKNFRPDDLLYFNVYTEHDMDTTHHDQSKSRESLFFTKLAPVFRHFCKKFNS